jgi:hypothetical protein
MFQQAVVNFSCDARRNGGSYFNFTGSGQLLVTVNSGPDGETNMGTVEKAAAAFAKTYATTKGDYLAKATAAAAAANKVIAKSQKKIKNNRGDHVDSPRRVS